MAFMYHFEYFFGYRFCRNAFFPIFATPKGKRYSESFAFGLPLHSQMDQLVRVFRRGGLIKGSTKGET